MTITKRRSRRLLVVAVFVAAAATVPALLQPAAFSDESQSLRDKVLQQQKLVAECMKDRGFEYIATLPNDLVVEEARHAAQLAGRDAEAAVEEASRNLPPDPNEALISPLPLEQQKAWGDALWGTDETAGCSDSTFSSAFKVNMADEEDEAALILAQVRSSPSVQAAEKAYIGCMKEQGYAVTSVDGIYEHVGRQVENLDTQARREITEKAYARHDACMDPYDETFNAVHLELLKGR